VPAARAELAGDLVANAAVGAGDEDGGHKGSEF
jgi:hypothetical protein